MSQTLRVPSTEQETRVRPSFDNATCFTSPVWAETNMENMMILFIHLFFQCRRSSPSLQLLEIMELHKNTFNGSVLIWLQLIWLAAWTILWHLTLFYKLIELFTIHCMLVRRQSIDSWDGRFFTWGFSAVGRQGKKRRANGDKSTPKLPVKWNTKHYD